MKVIKLIGHPVIFLILYLLLIIEGDQFGGFFMMYLLLTLPHLVPYSTIAALGMVAVIIGFNFKMKKLMGLKPIFYFIGLCLMLIALAIFFAKGNKWETFHFALPIISFLLFGISGFCFLSYTIFLFINAYSINKIKRISSE